MAGRVDAGQVTTGDGLGIAGVSSTVSCAQVPQLARWKASGMREDGTVCSEYPIPVSIYRREGRQCGRLHDGGDFRRRQVILEQIAQSLCIEHFDIR